jgi:phytoene/squalene synthetase
MNYNSNHGFNFKSVSEFAQNFAQKKSPKASKILDILIDKSKRNYVNLCYTYLRWVDDVVDDTERPLPEKKIFIEHQKNLITSLYKNYKNNNIESFTIEEACLIHFADYAKSNGNIILLDEVNNMVEALSMDVCRIEHSGIFSNIELDHYIELMSKSLYNIMYNFSLPKSKYREEFYLGSKLMTIALMIRDLEEDFDAGYINIGAEDIKYYNLDIRNLKQDKNLSLWLADRINYIFKILDEECAILKYLPPRFRIFTCYSLIYRLHWVIRAKVYGCYNLKFISERTFLKELRTYLLSLIISIKIFWKGFIYSPKVEIENVQQTCRLSLPEAVKIAGHHTRKRAPKLWLISHLMISKNKRKYVYFCFSYLRWVDDFIDELTNDKYDKVEFIENQLSLIAALSQNKIVEFKSKEEYFLYYCIRYAQTTGDYNLIYEGKRNIEALRMDAIRLCNNGIFSKDEQNQYTNKLVGPIFNLSCYLFFPSLKIKKSENYLGKFLQYVLAARDFFEDLDSGYVNICREDIEKYRLDINNLKKDKKRINWMRDKYPEYLEALEEDISIFRSMPLKIKLFWSPIYPYMIYELMRIKIYDYNFGEKLKKKLSKEIRVYLQSISLSLKFYLRIFV